MHLLQRNDSPVGAAAVKNTRNVITHLMKD